jgi:hypothetical protein
MRIPSTAQARIKVAQQFFNSLLSELGRKLGPKALPVPLGQ